MPLFVICLLSVYALTENYTYFLEEIFPIMGKMLRSDNQLFYWFWGLNFAYQAIVTNFLTVLALEKVEFFIKCNSFSTVKFRYF